MPLFGFGRHTNVDEEDRQMIEEFLARLPVGWDVARSRAYAHANIGKLLPALDKMPPETDRHRAVIAFMAALVTTCDVQNAEASMWEDADIPASAWPVEVSSGAQNQYTLQLVKDINQGRSLPAKERYP